MEKKIDTLLREYAADPRSSKHLAETLRKELRTGGRRRNRSQ